MSTETNQDTAAGEAGAGEGKAEIVDIDTIKKNYEATIGSLKRDLKEAKKASEPKETPQETAKPTDPSDLDYGQKALLRAIGIKGADEIQLAKDFMKRAGSDIDSLEGDEIFQARLTKLRDTKANELAAQGSSGRGAAAAGDPVAKALAKLGPNDPIPADLPRDVREKLVEQRRSAGETSKQFYND